MAGVLPTRSLHMGAPKYQVGTWQYSCVACSCLDPLGRWVLPSSGFCMRNMRNHPLSKASGSTLADHSRCDDKANWHKRRSYKFSSIRSSRLINAGISFPKLPAMGPWFVFIQVDAAILRLHTRRVCCLEFHPTKDHIVMSGEVLMPACSFI